MSAEKKISPDISPAAADPAARWHSGPERKVGVAGHTDAALDFVPPRAADAGDAGEDAVPPLSFGGFKLQIGASVLSVHETAELLRQNIIPPKS